MPTTLASTTRDLHAQWDLLRARLEELSADVLDEPSALPGWSVADLLAHVAHGLDAVTACEPQPEGTAALTLGEYLRASAGDTARAEAAVERGGAALSDDALAVLDASAERAFARLDELAAAGGDMVVLGRRGPVRLADLATSRLVELVVHSYDVGTDLPAPAPVEAGARHAVAEALREIVSREAGTDVLVGDETAWILVATGRIDWPTAVERGALRPPYLSDGLPDLSRYLPLV